MKPNYDVIIMGGGLAGLTLSLQLKQAKKDISILVLERRESAASDAAHKVGESTVELGTHYIREVLGLKKYMEARQLPKHGLRFFFSPKHKHDITKRVELGPKKLLPVPSHQIDRGSFENDMTIMSLGLGNEVEIGAKVESMDTVDGVHHVTYSINGMEKAATARWTVDATGRSSFLKRKFGFAQSVEHAVNSAWFRVDYKIDIDKWSDDPKWHSHVDPGMRFLSTVHLMDNGYWVWIIPLFGNRTSVGIVADPALHPFEEYNKLDKALDWIRKNEPQFALDLDQNLDKILDFKVMKHFAHGSGQLYSTDRWAVTGEAGFFLDPFYSPGTDFISMANTWLSDLILRDLDGEDVSLRTKVYSEVHRAIFENWLPIYEHRYPLWGRTQTMVAKIFWDWGAYWSINTLLFVNNGLTNITLLRRISAGPTSLLQRYGELSRRMQDLLSEFGAYDNADITNRYTDPFDLAFLRRFQEDIVEKQVETDVLLNKLHENMKVLEKIAAETYRLVSHQAFGTSLEMDVDPYTMTLNPNKKLESVNSIVVEWDDFVADEMRHMWLYSLPEKAMV